MVVRMFCPHRLRRMLVQTQLPHPHPWHRHRQVLQQDRSVVFHREIAVAALPPRNRAKHPFSRNFGRHNKQEPMPVLPLVNHVLNFPRNFTVSHF